MSDHDLLAGAIAARLRLQPDVQRLFPARPSLRRPVGTLTGLLGDAADQPAVTVARADPLRIEASIGIGTADSAVAAGRAGIAAILETVPAGTGCRITVRIAAIE